MARPRGTRNGIIMAAPVMVECVTRVDPGHLFQSDSREIPGEVRRVRYEAMTSLRRRRLRGPPALRWCRPGGESAIWRQAASLDHDRVSHGSDGTSRPGRSGASRPDRRFAREKCMLTKDHQSSYLSCRISRRLNAKLNTLTNATGRSRSDVLRWLILPGPLQDLPKGWMETAAKNVAYTSEPHRMQTSARITSPAVCRSVHAAPDAQGPVVKGSPRSPQSRTRSVRRIIVFHHQPSVAVP
jgi:hypothetical protein